MVSTHFLIVRLFVHIRHEDYINFGNRLEMTACVSRNPGTYHVYFQVRVKLVD
jgi:hypothetical protein